eukprot:TRINITY_DN4411_c0_g1_i6.p2 TRINITY_DN4411_c0_g1~~TRINITY_DN4411_c0_g1_i6.p2  ORF type:complete len:102 (-),score=22.76 TRINITY_DN4411_c0_g1_i6:249-554(-)
MLLVSRGIRTTLQCTMESGELQLPGPSMCRHALRTEPGGGGGCAGFQLRSESLGLKYLGTLGSVLQLLLLWAAGRSAQWVADWDAPGTAWRGMLAHKTQLV